jgi:hypothetical protein
MPRLMATTAAVLACLAVVVGCASSSAPLENGPVVPAGSLLSRLDVKLPVTTLSQFKGKAVLLTFIYDHARTSAR